MMNCKKISLSILLLGLMAATLFVAASCSKDEPADGIPLPDGMYPLTFTATQADPTVVPQTGIALYDEGDVTKCRWTTGDQIKVVVSGNGNDMENTCTLDADGNITAYNPQLYWKTAQNSNINAWYSNIIGQNTTVSTVSFADQSSKLAYVLKAEEITGAHYQSEDIKLRFIHQLAIVRVKLQKDASYTGDLTDVTVKLKEAYTSCTISEGEITAPGDKGAITMKNPTTDGTYYEANIIPDETGTSRQKDVFEIMAGGKTTTASLNSAVTFDAGKVYTVTIMVKPASIGDKTAEDAAVGDFYMKDGSLVDKDASLTDEQKKACVGIVFWVGDATAKDKTLKNDHSGCTHGLVVALKDAIEGATVPECATKWQSSNTFVQTWLDNSKDEFEFLPVKSDKGGSDPLNNIQGYNNTKAIEAFNAANSSCVVKAVSGVEDYRKANPVPATCSSWYLPSEKELTLLCGKDVVDIFTNGSGGTDNRKLINGQIKKLGDYATEIESLDYWSSTENLSSWAFSVAFNTGVAYNSRKDKSYRVRCAFAF